MNKLRVVLLIVLSLFVPFTRFAWGQPAASRPEASHKQADKEILVGANYFAGWWEPLPNKWHSRDGQDWRPLFPGRVPLLGQYNDQATMNREIIAAAEYGVDFFAILWYPGDPAGRERAPNARFLERGITCFVNSPEAGRMKFFIEFCNHPPFLVETDEHWDRCVKFWVETMRHRSYLRVGGRLVFKVHSAGGLVQQCGGHVPLAKARLETFRKAVHDAGLGEILIGGGVASRMAVPKNHWIAGLFDFTACYMDVPPLEQKEEDYPFDVLAEFTNSGREAHRQDAIPYLPYLAAGWNPRPWPDPRARFTLPTQEQWTGQLRRIKADLENCDRFGLPSPDGRMQKAFTIYCWNEFGEGSFLAPTRGESFMKLEAVKEVFSTTSQAPQVPKKSKN